MLFGSPTCAPCSAVKDVLARLAGERPGFTWTYVDAADHLEVVSTHRILRVPTLLVLDGRGRILARTSGVPRRQDLAGVLDEMDARRETVES